MVGSKSWKLPRAMFGMYIEGRPAGSWEAFSGGFWTRVLYSPPSDKDVDGHAHQSPTYVWPQFTTLKLGVFLWKLRLINLKGTFSVLAGSCWRTKNCLHFFWGPFLIQPIIFFVFVFSFSLFQRIGSENAVEGSWGVNSDDLSPKVHYKVC